MRVAQAVNNSAVRVMRWERNVDPHVRPAVDRVVRPPVAALTQALMRVRRPQPPLDLAEERIVDGEEEAAAAIIESMSAFLHKTYDGRGRAERAGNSKTYGVVRG